MTVGELLEIIPQIAVIDVTIRNNGRYCYEWVVGKYIQIHCGYSGEKNPEGERIPMNYALEDGERLDFPRNQFPATFWAIYPTEIGKDVKDLEVTDIRITHPFRSYLYKYVHEGIGWDAIQLYITCDIGDREYKKPRKEPNIVTDQMSLFDYEEARVNED